MFFTNLSLGTFDSFKLALKDLSFNHFDLAKNIIQNDQELNNLTQESFRFYCKKFLTDKDTMYNTDLLYNFFTIINVCEVKISYTLLFDWLHFGTDKFYKIKNKKFNKNNIVYQLAMLALVSNQKKNDIWVADFWKHTWLEGPKEYQEVSYLGLQYQDVDLACEQLPLLVKRNKNNVGLTILSMWKNSRKDEELSKKVINTIKNGMRQNRSWAFAAFSYLKGTLSGEELNRQLNIELGAI